MAFIWLNVYYLYILYRNEVKKLDILLEKLYKVVIDFEKIRYTDREAVTDYQINTQYTEGSFESYKTINTWTTYTTGDFWGAKGDYCWFKTDVWLPERFEGKKVIFSISTEHQEGWDISNPQFIIYVNDERRQGLDVNHKNTLLTLNAKAHSAYSIVMLGYSGLTDDRVILKSLLKVVDPLLEDFYYNLSNLFWALTLLDVNDSQRSMLIHHLTESVDFLDLRHVYSESFYKSVAQANQYLIDSYYTTVNLGGPVVSTIGHTHIDIAWLWSINQTKEKVIRSFSTVLELMKHYPDYKFMSSQPQLYAYVKEHAPSLYAQIKEKIIEGRWEVDGGMWLEADCNIPSGESLSRQLLYGTRFIQQEFHTSCSTLWLPDVFGYSAALPQLIKKSGMSYMMTSKLDWNTSNRLPHDTFIWRGIDGSEVLTHLVTTTNDVSYHENIYQNKNQTPQTTYNGRLNANQVKGTWTRYQDKLLSHETLQLFGFGDGGGGPTEEMLENYERLKYGLPGLPRVDMDFQKHYFDRLKQKGEQNKYLKKWQGELYLEFHQGTYTSMAKNKRANRKAELMYQTIEFLCSLAQLYNDDYVYPTQEIKSNWSRLLLYQFHDIIPGTSIAAVYEETDLGYQEIFSQGHQLLTHAIEGLAAGLGLKPYTCIVPNPLSHYRSDLVLLPKSDQGIITHVTDAQGVHYPVHYSTIKDAYYFLATDVPPKGIKVYTLHPSANELNPLATPQTHNLGAHNPIADDVPVETFENDFYRMTFDGAMNIVSLFDKKNHQEMIKEGGRGNLLQVFDDRPRHFDNWNIDPTFSDKCYEINHVEFAFIEEESTFYQVLAIKRCYGSSTLHQRIYLYHHMARIDFSNDVDWHEQHALLKVAFDIDLNTTEATYDIQYGNITRPTHNNTSWAEAQYEVCGHKWADLSEPGYGITLMNDCKYGYDIKDNCMRLSLIKCGTYPNENADQGHHQFTYAIYGHSKTWREADTINLSYDLNVALQAFHIQKPLPKATKAFDQLRFLSCSQENIIIDTIKMAEDADGTIIRLFESKNMRNHFQFESDLKIKSLYLCDLVENKLEKVDHDTHGFSLDIKGYEVITLHIVFERNPLL